MALVCEGGRSTRSAGSPFPVFFYLRDRTNEFFFHSRLSCRQPRKRNIFFVIAPSPGTIYVGSCGIALNSTTRRHPRLGLVSGSRGPTQIHIRALCHRATPPHPQHSNGNSNMALGDRRSEMDPDTKPSRRCLRVVELSAIPQLPP